jgi:iron complex outermembrane recepter protein
MYDLSPYLTLCFGAKYNTIEMSIKHIIFYSLLLFSGFLKAQRISGVVYSEQDKEPLIGASVSIAGTDAGDITDMDGRFEIPYSGTYPIELEISYIGFVTNRFAVSGPLTNLRLGLNEESITLENVLVKGQRVSDKQKSAALTVESLDLLAIKETASDNFYDGLGTLKGVDLTAASLGFKIINTRGFNSTSPVRSLQIIDGVDNQAPGLNFSLGNFLGSSELDVLKVDIVAGASSAFYGPNAFNGVISMETKDPFFQKGLSVQSKVGERSLFDIGLRFADTHRNKKGQEYLGYKINGYFMRAYDWEADNYDPVFESETPGSNPGRFDAVNIYGDEYNRSLDLSTAQRWVYPGFRTAHRVGYREIDLVDYNTRNYKASGSLHLRTQPAKGAASPELIAASSFGSGTTVYQGDNRFSLRNILFFQNRLEFRKRDKYFIRAYATHENAGDSYDPYFTALRLQQNAKTDENWARDYIGFWQRNIRSRAEAAGFPRLMWDPETQGFTFDFAGADQWEAQYQDSLRYWHELAAAEANKGSVTTNSQAFFEPGTERFDEEFRRITSAKSNAEEQGTRFYDRSALYHVHGEYRFTPVFTDEIVVGSNARLYTPDSDGTIFSDTAGIQITNFEFGLYTGIKKTFFNERLTTNATLRTDKNQNFNWIFTPAVSMVYQPDELNFLRLSFSSALRNPTLADQYLNLNVGRAILAGNLNGWNDLITVESFRNYLSTLNPDDLSYFNVAPVRPERVKTFEAGYRTTLFDQLYMDLGYYYSIYNDFLGFNIGLQSDFDAQTRLPSNTQAYRIAANSLNEVTTQGASIGLNYFFSQYYMISGNYSWNRLNKTFEDDPIIPAFNTPEHKFNVGFSFRNLDLKMGSLHIKNLGFNINYKWIQGFLFEGSPQFTGMIPTYDLLDGQLNYTVDRWNTTFKIGGSNLLNKKQFQTYGGPRIGRLAYFSVLYEFRKK